MNRGFQKKAIEFLKEKKYCLVWNDVHGVNNPMLVTSKFLYVRLIGDRSIPDSKFGKVVLDKREQIENLASKLKDIQDIPLAMIMTNNHFEEFSHATTNSLRMKLRIRELVWGGNAKNARHLLDESW